MRALLFSSLVVARGLLAAVASPVVEHGLYTHLAALRPAGSSWSRHWTHVPCVVGGILSTGPPESPHHLLSSFWRWFWARKHPPSHSLCLLCWDTRHSEPGWLSFSSNSSACNFFPFLLWSILYPLKIPRPTQKPPVTPRGAFVARVPAFPVLCGPSFISSLWPTQAFCSNRIGQISVFQKGFCISSSVPWLDSWPLLK